MSRLEVVIIIMPQLQFNSLTDAYDMQVATVNS